MSLKFTEEIIILYAGLDRFIIENLAFKFFILNENSKYLILNFVFRDCVDLCDSLSAN